MTDQPIIGLRLRPRLEASGIHVPLFAGYIIFAIFQIAVAVPQTVETIMPDRFCGGLFAPAPLARVFFCKVLLLQRPGFPMMRSQMSPYFLEFSL
jgi:hypothetical protein